MGISYSRFVVYLQDIHGHLVPIEYPDTLEKLKKYLSDYYNFKPAILTIQESSEHVMYISTETSYRALVPKHKLVEPNMNVYYIIVNLPFVITSKT
jgi:hypothetical protein